MNKNSKNQILELFVSYLLEKGGVKKGDSIKFYTPELMIKDKKTKVEYEVSEIDKSDPNDMVFTLFRFDADGKRFELAKPAKEIKKDFELV